MSDEELELLENYLDGAIGPDDRDRVERRLARDAEWSEALEALRTQRELRRSAWASYELDVAAADGAGRRAASRAVAAERASRLARFARRAAAVAAAVVLSFAGGWAARGRAAAPSPTADVAQFQVAITDEGGNIIAVQHFDDPRRARQFAEDVGRWQARRHEEVGDFSQASDEF